jgi:hypothetical protein
VYSQRNKLVLDGARAVGSYQFDACPLSTEEQVSGLYGGNVDALTDMYADEIQMVNDILDMAGYDAHLCDNINPDYEGDVVCTMFETGYEFTGQYFQGMFTSPFYYAQYFARHGCCSTCPT